MPSAMQIRQMPCHVPVINDDRRVSEGISRENRPIKSGETPKLGESIPRGNFRDVCSRRIRLGSAVCIRFSRRSRIYWPGLMPMRKRLGVGACMPFSGAEGRRTGTSPGRFAVFA